MTGKNEEYHPEDTFDSLSALLIWVKPLVKHLEYPTAKIEELTGRSQSFSSTARRRNNMLELHLGSSGRALSSAHRHAGLLSVEWNFQRNFWNFVCKHSVPSDMFWIGSVFLFFFFNECFFVFLYEPGKVQSRSLSCLGHLITLTFLSCPFLFSSQVTITVFPLTM